MILSWLFVLLGALLLFIGAELLLRSSLRLSKIFSYHFFDAGITFGAFAVSLPLALLTNFGTFAPTAQSAALQNSFGVCIANIGLALGLYLLFQPCKITSTIRWRKLPLLFLVYLVVFFVMVGGKISKAEGVYLLIVLFFFSLAQFFFPEQEREKHNDTRSVGGLFLQIGIYIASCLLLFFGTKYLLNHFNVPSLAHFSSVTFGLILPQLAVAIPCLFHKKGEFFLGTILGSNAFTILLTIPLSALKKPIHFFERFLTLFFPIMVFFTLLLWLLTFQKKGRLTYFDGVILLFSYAAYLAFLFFR